MYGFSCCSDCLGVAIYLVVALLNCKWWIKVSKHRGTIKLIGGLNLLLYNCPGLQNRIVQPAGKNSFGWVERHAE